MSEGSKNFLVDVNFTDQNECRIEFQLEIIIIIISPKRPRME